MIGPRFAAVVFDMDGVIFDSERLYFDAEDELLRRRGHRFTPELAGHIMGLPGVLAMEKLIELLRLEGCDGPGLFTEAQALFRAKLPHELQLMDGFADFFAAVEARALPRAVATSTHRELALSMLGSFELPTRFHAVLTRDDVTRGKPDPEVFTRACEALGTSPEETLAIEDSANGVLSAAAAGCQVVAVRHSHNRGLEFPQARFVAASLRDPRLLEFLDSGPKSPF
ncbi:MAG TPA: HAD-IA family hydrolase [Planctomycetia bacterium]|nr:HAD-IA family hydrolase [Planctomycetia bacterium]